MNQKDMNNNKIEHLLSKAHPSEPSPLMKEQITAEARKVWSQTLDDMPWQIPIIRLAASAAAAMLIISITNIANNIALEKWRPGNVSITRKQSPDLDIVSEIPYRPFVRRMVSVNRKPSIRNASALRNYAERVRQILNETQQNSASNGQVPDGERSRLFPVNPISDYYS